MKFLKKTRTYLLFTILITAVFFLPSYSSLAKRNPDLEVLPLDAYEFKNFSENFPIFGYKLVATDPNPIDRDESGLLIMTQKKTDFMNISLKLKSGVYNYKDIYIEGKIFIDLEDNHAFYYEINDPFQGFFMEMVINSNLTYINLAFDGGDYQFCYDGLIPLGHLDFSAAFTQKIELIQLNVHNYVDSEDPSLSFNDLIEKIKIEQMSNIKIYKRDQETETALRGYITFTDYGIAHERVDWIEVNLAEDLPDDYWEPYSEIDIGIYRRKPSESQIKSDLQYYNKDRIQGGHGYVRDIKAYAIYAESEPSLNTAWTWRDHQIWDWWLWMWIWVWGYIYPSEIEALWYHSYDPLNDIEIDVHPNDMIIHATVCYGYSGNDGIPHMAKAFVDHGAEAFVGATVEIPGLHNDEYTGDFWYSLSQSDETVYQATLSYIETHNYYDDYEGGLNIDWIYNTHIKIYGNINAKLDN